MLDINDFKENLVEYECARIRDTRTVWMNDAESGDLAGVLDPSAPETSFARFFSYVSQANACFGANELDKNDRRVYLAERYGARGVGSNGGGGRVGNYGKFQVKGTGPNPLASATSIWHSYGSLNMVDAANETIYSTVLGSILPMGCAKIYGVIHTSDAGALQVLNWGRKDAKTSSMSGALLVREPTVRPAHFMHAEYFMPDKSGLMPESRRIRAVHRQLKTKFENTNNFIQFIGKFVLSSAKQFAFARAARIAHGGVTPSNICLDGRWIDLTEARFLTGGKNYSGQMPFYDEPQVISEVVMQLTYIFGKSNVAQFNVEPLLRYCQKVFDNCFSYYSLSILGLPEANLEAIAEGEDGKTVAKAYAAVVMKEKRPILEVPDQVDPDDPVIAFMKLSYLCLSDNEVHLAKLSALLRCPASDARQVVTAFRNVFRHAVKPLDQNAGVEAFRGRSLASAIKALRWAYLSAYFYRGRITPHLYYLVENKDLSDVGAYIQENIDQSKWIFDTACTGNVVILQAKGLRIAFDEPKRIYVVTDANERTFQRYEDCVAFISANYPALRVSDTFDPSFYLQGISDVLTGLDNMTCMPA